MHFKHNQLSISLRGTVQPLQQHVPFDSSHKATQPHLHSEALNTCQVFFSSGGRREQNMPRLKVCMIRALHQIRHLTKGAAASLS